jgi:hypothetical protein
MYSGSKLQQAWETPPKQKYFTWMKLWAEIVKFWIICVWTGELTSNAIMTENGILHNNVTNWLTDWVNNELHGAESHLWSHHSVSYYRNSQWYTKLPMAFFEVHYAYLKNRNNEMQIIGSLLYWLSDESVERFILYNIWKSQFIISCKLGFIIEQYGCKYFLNYHWLIIPQFDAL